MGLLLDLPLIGTILKKLKVKKNLDLFAHMLNKSEKEVQEYQFKKLSQMVKHAFENVPLYREKWTEAGVGPGDLTKLEDLAKFPIISKDDLRKAYPDGLRAKGFNPRKCHIVGTSGSTGSSMKMFYSRDKTFYELAFMSPYSLNLHLDLNLHSALSIFAPDEDAMEILFAKEFKKLKHFLLDALDEPENHLEAINRQKPDLISSYPGVLKNCALYARQNNIKVHQPVLISTGAECLDAHTREIIEKTFKCKLIDCYVSTEGGVMAGECFEHNGLHTIPYKSVIEIVDDAGNPLPAGEHGSVILTDLVNMATPIIRYSGMGDLSGYKKERCSCKLKNFPLLERIDGRKADTVVLPGNKVINPFKLVHVMDHKRGVAKFQIRHEKMDELKILIVKDTSPEAEEVEFSPGCPVYEQITGELREVTGEGVEIKIELVDDIWRKEGSHKYQLVYSLFHQ